MIGRKLGQPAVSRAAAAILFCASVVSATIASVPASAAPAQNPVIFLAGYDTSGQPTDSCADGQSSFSAEIKDRLSSEGYPDDKLIDFCYNNGAEDLHSVSAALGDFVKQTLAATGSAKVDLVGYSMGGLPAYECTTQGACHGLVDHFVAISTPFNGTTLASLICNNAPEHPCAQMQPNSAYLNSVVTGSPSGAQTWTVVHAFADDVVPPASTSLPGAKNVTIQQNDDGGAAITGLGLTNHGATPHNAQTVEAVASALLG